MPASKPKPKRVLVVDDDPIQREFAQMNLASSGVQIVVAASAMEAQRTLASGGCDLVVSDYEMPGMNGLELIAAIRQNPATRKLPIILATSSEDLATMNAAHRLGISSFALKPVNWRTLEIQVRNALQGG